MRNNINIYLNIIQIYYYIIYYYIIYIYIYILHERNLPNKFWIIGKKIRIVATKFLQLCKHRTSETIFLFLHLIFSYTPDSVFRNVFSVIEIAKFAMKQLFYYYILFFSS